MGNRIVKNIRTRSGKLIARIEQDPRTGVEFAYDNLGNLKGKYRPDTNTTYDHRGTPVSTGDSLVALVLNAICPEGVGVVCHPVAVVKSSFPVAFRESRW
jgi:hypothetical protein